MIGAEVAGTPSEDDDVLERVREAYARREWAAARRDFTEANRNSDLHPSDLYALSHPR